ncbi:cupin domain-containing protein [Kineococcus sp. GCM10028916]|uniref:cupin domain-containing protein n=1 Tax=Kineococcus sp. GCM10028916 TaxID=3273394 RepID=UPI00363B624B
MGDPAVFTGHVTARALRVPDGRTRLAAYEVTFAAGARTHWHSHPHGQLLVVTAGVARVQLRGEAAVDVATGNTAWIPPGVLHWHGAGPSGSMTHIAAQEATSDGRTVTWGVPVSDATFDNHRPPR